MSEIKAIIKDCIFESVMMGSDIKTTLNDLHFRDGFKKEDIIEAYNEMLEQVNS